MPRPTTKDGLIQTAQMQYDKLADMVEGATQEERTATFLFEDRDRNIRDVLIHLYEWHKLFIDWANDNTKGIDRDFLPKPYNWRTYPQMNVEIWKKHQNTSLEDARKMLENTHYQSMEIIKSFDEEQLFVKKLYKWTGNSNLAAYAISSTSSHYDWAMKKIKRHLTTYRLVNKG